MNQGMNFDLSTLPDSTSDLKELIGSLAGSYTDLEEKSQAKIASLEERIRLLNDYIEHLQAEHEEMAAFENIIKSAVNFDADRGDKIEVANIAYLRQDIGESVGFEESLQQLEHLINSK